MTWKRISQMRRFITRPNSKIDKRIILALNIIAYINFSFTISSIFTTWWVQIILIIIIGVVVAFTYESLYYIKYDPSFVKMRLEAKVEDFLCVPGLGCYDIPKACKLIDEICNATIVQIEERKFLYDQMCTIWTVYGGGSIYKVYSVPGFITEKWKRAVIEYKKYEIEND